MIKPFTYTAEQWLQITTVVLEKLGLDADQLQIRTPRRGEKNVFVMYPLRVRLEGAAGVYAVNIAAKYYSLTRDKLVALRRKAANFQAEIKDALAVPIPNKHFKVMILLVENSMLTKTDDYFRQLLPALDRLIEQAGPRSGNARKTARDHCWNELLAIWCVLGGKATGKAAASFLQAASIPVMGSAVPDVASIMQWLERRRNKSANKVTRRRYVGTSGSRG